MNLQELKASYISKISPSLYGYEELSDGFQLYLGACSTIEGLSLLRAEQEIIISQFGATSYKHFGWATETDIPHQNSVASTIQFLASESSPDCIEADIGLIDFKARLPGLGSLSTHDDGECNFQIYAKPELIRILQTVSPPQYRDKLIYELLANPGFLMTFSESGDLSKYRSFSEYLRYTS